MQTLRELEIPAMTSLPGLLTRLSQILYSGVWADQSLWIGDWLGPLESLVDVPCSESKDPSIRWIDQIHPRDRACYQSAMNELISQGKEGKLEYRLLTGSDQERFVQDHVCIRTIARRDRSRGRPSGGSDRSDSSPQVPRSYSPAAKCRAIGGRYRA